MQLTNANKVNYILIIVAALVILYFTSGISIRHDGDDQYFINLLSTNDIWGILKSRYLTWSGRLGVEFLLLHTIQYNYFWMIAIPVSIFVTCYSLTVITGEKNNIGFTIILAVFLFTLINKSVLKDAVLWVTGFYNYLLPAALAAITISICLKPYRYIGIAKIIPLLAPFVYAYSEQVALTAILALLLVFIFSKDCHKNLCLMSLIITIINFLVCYLSPGSSVRAQTEAWFAFPDYLTLNIVQKVSLGVYVLHTHLSDYHNTPYLILLASCFASAMIASNKEPLILTASFFVALQIAFMIYMRNQQGINALSFTPERFTSMKTYASVLIDLLSFFSVMYISFKCFGNSMIISIALTIGAISVVAIGLSPTVFSSGTRTMFVFDIAAITSVLSIAGFLMRKKS